MKTDTVLKDELEKMHNTSDKLGDSELLIFRVAKGLIFAWLAPKF